MPAAVQVAGAMPVKTVEIDLSPAGYEGWSVTMRTNPPARIYDDFCSGEVEVWWGAMKSMVLAWNFASEEGEPLPLPKDGCDVRDLPSDLINHVVRAYIVAYRENATPPKEPSLSTETG